MRPLSDTVLVYWYYAGCLKSRKEDTMERFWTYDSESDRYIPTEAEPFTAFPTILNLERKLVYCRYHHSWESIRCTGKNMVKSSCGRTFSRPFLKDYSDFIYGYKLTEHDGVYKITVYFQIAGTNIKKTFEEHYAIDTKKRDPFRIIFKNEQCMNTTDDDIFSTGSYKWSKMKFADFDKILCDEVTDAIIDDMGERYRSRFGIKPTISSNLKGFPLILGYMRSPFNVNFFRISEHWSLELKSEKFSSSPLCISPDAENLMFESMGVRPTRTLRKIYQKNPKAIICYAAAQYLGFTDVNILQKSMRWEFYNLVNFIHFPIRNYFLRTLEAFTRDMLRLSDQQTVWNSLVRTMKLRSYNSREPVHASPETDFDDIPIPWSCDLDNSMKRFVDDGLKMYADCSRFLTEREKRMILKEGFNKYVHDFLVNRWLRTESDRKKLNMNQNVHFRIEQKFLDLEYKTGSDFQMDPKTNERKPVPDNDRWCFYVARDSNTLTKIGSEMYNCVGSYKSAVYSRLSTIVYAMYKGLYRICIELAPDFSVRQAYASHNRMLSLSELRAYNEWCREKNIPTIVAEAS